MMELILGNILILFFLIKNNNSIENSLEVILNKQIYLKYL